MSAPKGPFHLVSVNTAPERAKRLIGRVAEALSDRYTIIHVDNCEKIDEVEDKVKQHNPEVLHAEREFRINTMNSSAPLCGLPEEAQQIHQIARSVRPDIKLHAIPQGLQVERGPDAIVEHLLEKVPVLLDS
ncbi:hypothetical protein N7497_001993 [Penicillium chrysogenum]|nr:hypothetical protein N7497_001993 [Penicillium chrysogenum]